MICTGKSISKPRADRGNAHLPVLRVFAVAEDDPKYGVLSAKQRWQIELPDSAIRNIAPVYVQEPEPTTAIQR
jgi:hypothetical protein